ncbi:MAG TPA: hypothetical protein DEW97_02365, partial [Sutterella wadsworthensis]|nr:hypothetical protein [Sutterella wadsworthensis]
KTYWFIFRGLAQQNNRSLTLITRVRDLLSGSSGRKDKALSVGADWAFALLAVPHGTVMAAKTANSEAAPRWREASDTLPLNRESDHTGTSEYRIAKFSVIGAE